MSNLSTHMSSFYQYLNPDGGFPYTPGGLSYSEPTLLMILAFKAAGAEHKAQHPITWVLGSRNADGSIGLNREFPEQGLWNSPLFAITMHHLGKTGQRDAAIDFILKYRSIRVDPSPDNDIDTTLIGWPWAPDTFGWVEPTAWALLALSLAGRDDHPRATEGRRLLENRCLREGGWNYGNRVVFNQALMPFWDTTALALLALGESNPELIDRNLEFLEKACPEIQSLLATSMACICLDRFGRDTKELRKRIAQMLGDTGEREMNIAHCALGIIALSQKKVFAP